MVKISEEALSELEGIGESVKYQSPIQFSSQAVVAAFIQLTEYCKEIDPSAKIDRIDYAVFSQDIEPSNHQLIQSIIRAHPDSLIGLIGKYRNDFILAQKDELFKKKISEMTGYEFQEYLKQIDIVK